MIKTNTLTYYNKSKKSQWLIFFGFLLGNKTVKTTADKVGICENTVLAWRHKTMYLIYKMIEHDKMKGLIHLDETFFDCIYKGRESIEITDKKRGISNDKIGVSYAIDEANHIIMKVISQGKPTANSLIEIFKLQPCIKYDNENISADNQKSNRLFQWLRGSEHRNRQFLLATVIGKAYTNKY